MIKEERVQQKYSGSLLRKGIYNIEDILSKRVAVNTPKDKIKVVFDGDLIKMNSERYEVFDVKGIKCVCCGLEGKYFAKERPNDTYPYHFNLYAINDKNEEVLMTKDHIVAKSNGGRNHIDNYQPMCTICNLEKGIEEKVY